MRIALVVHTDQQESRTIHLHRLPFVIGRNPTCNLRPAHPSVSKRHCALEALDGRLVLRDLGSTNGTLINGRLLRDGALQLRDRDLVVAGTLTFTVRLLRAAACPEPADAAGEEAANDYPGTSQPEDSTEDTQDSPALAGAGDDVAQFLLDEPPEEVAAEPEPPAADGNPPGKAPGALASASAAEHRLREYGRRRLQS